MGKFIGIDYGRARIGIAITDDQKKMSLPLYYIKSGRNHAESCLLLMKTLEQYEIELFVLGLPVMLSGKDSIMTEEVRAFALILQEISAKPVVFIDERFSSTIADRMLKTGGLNRKKRAKHVDAVAATLILDLYLEQNK